MSAPLAYVRATSFFSGLTALLMRNFDPPEIRWLIKTASPRALDASYMLQFTTSIPVSSVMNDWYSNSAWSIPWLISGWYGVYDVMNSERITIVFTAAGMKW